MTSDSDTSGGAAESVAPANPSRLRRWIFRLIAIVVIPLVLLGGTEMGLRIAGYGYDTRFWVKDEAAGRYVVNQDFGLRFFPPSLMRVPWPIWIAAEKPEGAVRIFVMGGSAALGIPDPGFNAGEVLEAMLAQTYPEATFEVVTAAMTAINSHVVLPIARACAERQPDLFIIYLGNNEVVGPFGAGTVFAGYTPSLSAIRASLAVRTTKLGQLAENILRPEPSLEDQAEWTGMEMFTSNLVAADDSRLVGVYDHFRQNLRDICQVAREADAETILCTVAVNLKDCSPFASMHKAGLSESDLATWEEAFAAGIERADAGDHAGAIERFVEASAIDSRYAELRFRTGLSHLATGRPGPAGQLLSAARDLDGLRFRADSDINKIIREVAVEEGADVHLVDAEQSLGALDASGATAPGSDMFYEHVHLTFDGNYQVARAMFPVVVARLPEAIRAAGPESPTPPTRAQAAEALGLTAWGQAQMYAYMLQMIEHPPFTEQFDYDQRYEALKEMVRRYESQDNSSGDAP
jgi:hypothetical protein